MVRVIRIFKIQRYISEYTLFNTFIIIDWRVTFILSKLSSKMHLRIYIMVNSEMHLCNNFNSQFNRFYGDVSLKYVLLGQTRNNQKLLQNVRKIKQINIKTLNLT